MGTTLLGLSGYWWAIMGAGFAAIISGIGSSIGIVIAAATAAGVLSEDDTKFGRILPLVAMPGTQGIYGFIAAVLVLVFFGILGGKNNIPLITGVAIFFACQPVAWLCFLSAIYQGRAGVAAIEVVAADKKAPALVFPALVETYAILSLIVTILMLLGISASIG